MSANIVMILFIPNILKKNLEKVIIPKKFCYKTAKLKNLFDGLENKPNKENLQKREPILGLCPKHQKAFCQFLERERKF